MSQLEIPSVSLNTLHQQAFESFQQKRYEQASAHYEHLIELDPKARLYYWELGLVQLLQGNEAEAQLVWTVALSEGEPAQIEAWTAELCDVLRAEIDRQVDQQQEWLIRQHIHELDSTDLSNLLHILSLSVKLEYYIAEEDLIMPAIASLLDSVPAPKIDATLLQGVFQEVFETQFTQPTLFLFTVACIPHFSDIEIIADLLLEKLKLLAFVYDQNYLACKYAELCLQFPEKRSELLFRLSLIYHTLEEHTKSVEFAESYTEGCQTLVQKIFGTALVLKGVMNLGNQWSRAEILLARQTELLQSLLGSYELTPDERLDSAILTSALYPYSYLGDHPEIVRSLQNKVAKLVQDSAHLCVAEHFQSYQPYPHKTFVQRTRQKLRIGYLAHFFKRHSVGWLSRWVFEHFDRDRFEVYTYFNGKAEIDDFGRRWFADNSTQACGFTGNMYGIAEDIQADEIDILIDLDSLTSDATCDVMLLKPAPIQITWLGLDASGLPAIDYFMADPYVLPENAQDYYSEKIWRLPQTYIAVDGFEVGVPTLRRDQIGISMDAVIYFSSQFVYKRNPQMLRLQMQILKAVPNSYFLIKGQGNQDGIELLFHQMAEEVGVSIDRLRFLSSARDEETHRANLAIADVVLDTFPYNGATTTMETLWMGIPMVTRVGQQFAARNSYGMMMNAGITEGIAWTDKEYVEWGIRLGQDAALRQDIHWRLMRSRQTSPLWNAKQFTHDLEMAYEQMWKLYLEA